MRMCKKYNLQKHERESKGHHPDGIVNNESTAFRFLVTRVQTKRKRDSITSAESKEKRGKVSKG